MFIFMILFLTSGERAHINIQKIDVLVPTKAGTCQVFVSGKAHEAKESCESILKQLNG